MKKQVIYLSVCFLIALNCQAQLFNGDKPAFTHADSLRGFLLPIRSCYDVKFYDLSVTLNIPDESILGSNSIWFEVVSPTKMIQVDLTEKLSVASITDEHNNKLNFSRDGNAIMISFPTTLNKGMHYKIKIDYFGKPVVGKMLPWDGGLKWTKDEDGLPWVAVACQGTGASVWWPCKDHQSDEPDSMMINITVPKELMDISNGRLRKKTPVGDDMMQYSWFVSYPINTYNVTINVGAFAHFNDWHVNNNDTLTLDYYVKSYNLEKAKKQFEQVKPMLNCFEKYFGKYPFYRDGYKLVETPYLGMEHQSCIAYGNKYKTGYMGMDFSGIGLDFDYIIIHETAHEWWGNNITTKDIADMWVHEGFGSYAEVLYTECLYGKAKAFDYVNAQRKKVGNKTPIIGPYDVNIEGSGDMYPKGSLLINTIRQYIDNDSLFFSILMNIQKTFAYQTITSANVESLMTKQSGKNLTPIFDQYLRHAAIPVFEYEVVKEKPFQLRYRWKADVADFDLPVRIDCNKENKRLNVTTQWQETTLAGFDSNCLIIRDDLGYFKVTKLNK
jgi:aminopeptidase N